MSTEYIFLSFVVSFAIILQCRFNLKIAKRVNEIFVETTSARLEELLDGANDRDARVRDGVHAREDSRTSSPSQNP